MKLVEKQIDRLNEILNERYDKKITAEKILGPNKKHDSIVTKLKRRKIWFTQEEEIFFELSELNLKINRMLKRMSRLFFWSKS